MLKRPYDIPKSFEPMKAGQREASIYILLTQVAIQYT